MKNLTLILTATLISSSIFAQTVNNNSAVKTNLKTNSQSNDITDAEEDEFSEGIETGFLPEPMVKGNHHGEFSQKVMENALLEEPMVKGERYGDLNPKTEDNEMQEVPMIKGNHYGKFEQKMAEQENVFESIPTSSSTYPNPNDGVFTVRFDQSQQGVTRVEVIDMNGRTVFVQDLGQSSGNSQEQVNLGEFGAGHYTGAIQQGSDRPVNR